MNLGTQVGIGSQGRADWDFSVLWMGEESEVWEGDRMGAGSAKGEKLHSQLGGSREALGNMDMSNKGILICLL